MANQAITEIPTLKVAGTWEQLLTGEARQELEQLLPEVLRQRRWFGGKARNIQSATISEAVPVPHSDGTSYLALVTVTYEDGIETYVLALSHAVRDRATRLIREESSGVLVRVQTAEGEGVLYDGVRDRGFVIALLDLIEREGDLPPGIATLVAEHTSKFDELAHPTASDRLEPRVVGAEQSNSSIIFGERLIMKLFRRLQGGVNPDLEIGQFLTEHGYFNSPPVVGSVELAAGEGEPATLAILQGFVPNRGDAWKYSLDSLAQILARAQGRNGELGELDTAEVPIFELIKHQAPSLITELSGDYLESVRLLGQRTAELHLTLNSDSKDPSFAPEPFSRSYQDAVYRGMRRMATAVLALLRSQVDRLKDGERDLAAELVSREPELLELFRPILSADLHAQRIRIHGDYHLGQVLYAGEDFVIIDFEGEPLRSLSERRIKRSPLRDVAGMMRSFDYAGQTALANLPERTTEVAQFVESWTVWTAALFAKSYFETCGEAPFLPADPAQTAALLDAFRLDKAVYELGYEINNRPTWVRIPLVGIARILRQHGSRLEQRAA